MINRITCGLQTFNDDNIKSVNLHLASSLLSSQLEADTLTAVVRSDDPSITQFARNTPIRYYHKDIKRFQGYLQSVDRVGADSYSISATSAIGLLMERPHPGGIYTGQTADQIIREIVGIIPFAIKSNIRDTKLYGWLPYAKPPEKSARDNLSQVLFALGAAVKTDLDGVLRIAPLWDGVSGEVVWDTIYEEAKAQYAGAVSAVSVTEHQYMVGGEETQLFEGTSLSGDPISFSEPMYNLSATGFTILESGANYAKLSSGSGTLTGRKYVHTTRQISRTVTAGAPENVKNIEDATLVSLVNSSSVTDRLANYYKHAETISCDVVLDRQSPGDVLDVYHPYDKTAAPACVESLDITASGILKARLTALVGFRPKQIEQTVVLNQHQVITVSGTVTLPDGVTSVLAVLIGGGTGGDAGTNGEAGGDGVSTSATSAADSSRAVINTGAGGKGGSGGNPGNGGEGGKFATFEITGDTIKTLEISIGSAGIGGTSNGGTGKKGGATTLKVNGVTYSSASGQTSAGGYQDLVTGTVYATSGTAGKAGAKGGDGGSPTGTPDDLVTAYAGGNGSNAGSYKGGTGGKAQQLSSSSYSARVQGGGGGGGAAYNQSGSSGNLQTGGKGAAGSKPAASSVRGGGGNGGNGGGGGGGGGGTMSASAYGTSVSTSAGAGGTGGTGSAGGNAGGGAVILYYGVAEPKTTGGALRDKNGKLMLDRLGRILVS